MGDLSTKNVIKRIGDKELLYTVNKLRKEREHKKRFGDYGTGNYVSSHEFWGRKNIRDIKAEFEKRKKRGVFSKSAGMSRKKKKDAVSRQTRRPLIGGFDGFF